MRKTHTTKNKQYSPVAPLLHRRVRRAERGEEQRAREPRPAGVGPEKRRWWRDRERVGHLNHHRASNQHRGTVRRAQPASGLATTMAAVRSAAVGAERAARQQQRSVQRVRGCSPRRRLIAATRARSSAPGVLGVGLSRTRRALWPTHPRVTVAYARAPRPRRGVARVGRAPAARKVEVRIDLQRGSTVLHPAAH